MKEKKYRILYKTDGKIKEWYVKAKNESFARQIFIKFMGSDCKILDVDFF